MAKSTRARRTAKPSHKMLLFRVITTPSLVLATSFACYYYYLFVELEKFVPPKEAPARQYALHCELPVWSVERRERVCIVRGRISYMGFDASESVDWTLDVKMIG